MTKKNIATQIILTIITCGIYGIIWFITLTDDAANASDDHSMSGGVAFLLTIITCGIYGIYWAYKMGKMMATSKEKAGLAAADNSILYLILQLFGLSIVNYCLIQSDLNDIVDAK